MQIVLDKGFLFLYKRAVVDVVEVIIMTKEEFLKQYILSRTSHKKTIDEICNDALKAWSWIHEVTHNR